ncbi:MAG: hypothetical protein OXB97_13185, partial [Rhodospirillales bacterium]|nr:hypothetical protein [Rhodospirillales bacterium]
MGLKHLAGGDLERIRADGLHALFERAGFHRLLDVGVDAFLELREQLVLLVDRQREQPVQEPGHWRQVVLQVAFPREFQAGGGLEPVERPAGDVPGPERAIELSQCGPRVRAFQVVAGLEQRRVRIAQRGLGVSLTARQRPEAVQASRDGGDEPAFALHIRGHRAEHGRGCLVRAVGPAQPLDGQFRPPPGFKKVVDSPRRVAAAEIGVVTAPGAAGHREHEDPFGALHERRGFGEVGRGRSRLERHALAAGVEDPEHAPGPAGHLGHGLVPE